MKALWLLVLFPALTLGAAADVTGKWVGTAEFKTSEGEVRGDPAMMIFKQEGEKLTGTVGPHDAEQFPISNGKVEGDRLSFEVVLASGTARVEMKIEGDELKGEGKQTRADGSVRTAKLSLKRAPAQ